MSPRRTGQARETVTRRYTAPQARKFVAKHAFSLVFEVSKAPERFSPGTHKEKHIEHEARPLATLDPNFHMFVTAM